MSWSNHEFTTGLDLGGPRGTATPSVVTAAPFSRVSRARNAPVEFRPMVFRQFGSVAEVAPSTQQDDESLDMLAQVDVVEAEEPIRLPDFEAIKAAAWAEGFQQGYDEGQRLAAEEQHDTGTRLSTLLQGVAADTEAFVRGLEDDVVELALAIAEKVIARETRIDPDIIVNVVRSALSEVHDATELRIRANPDDVPLLEPRWQEMLPRSVAEHSELIADELVERGGVIVETRIGYADSQLKTRLNQVVTTFQAVLDGEPV
jgi:flagellar biosynthesis/type III secretory pathway protein FliH